MTNFKDDCLTMLVNGNLKPKNGKIRFIFRYGEKLNGDIDVLELNTRAYNCLKRSGVNTIDNISEKWDELGRLKNAGIQTIKEIKNKYITYYYDLLDDDLKQEFWNDTIQATNDI